MEANPWVYKVFIPSQCLTKNSGVLVGCQSTNKSMCFITGLMDIGSVDKLELMTSDNRHGVAVLGYWQNLVAGELDSRGEEEASIKSHFADVESWLLLSADDAEMPRCTLCGRQEEEKEVQIMIVVYDSASLSRSEILMSSASKLSQGQTLESEQGLCHLEQVSRSWNNYLAFLEQNKDDISSQDCLIPSVSTWKDSVWDVIFWTVWSALHRIIGIFSLIVSARLLQTWLMKTVLSLPSTLKQLRQRSCAVEESIEHTSGAQYNQGLKLRVRTVIMTQLLDSILGIAVMYWFLHSGCTSKLASQMMTWAEHVASELQNLLNWMMGAPAGLKLNQELAHFLGHFFLYHIYLWTAYLRYLAPVLSDALWWLSLSGCLGATVQLAFVQDLFSMMTLHIYCFYVYAARLYSLQIYALSSLWRLFRGKKWNVLRNRVDSASYDVDQLFLGTLLFTVLLFLLPTTGLFYGVFTALRLVVLMIQGVIGKVVTFINTCPFYLLVVGFVDPSTIAGDVQFHVIPTVADRPLYLAMQLLPVPVASLWPGASCGHHKAPGYSWTTLMGRILRGNLIYPWIDYSEDSKEKTD